jgi:hypothetical protein
MKNALLSMNMTPNLASNSQKFLIKINPIKVSTRKRPTKTKMYPKYKVMTISDTIRWITERQGIKVKTKLENPITKKIIKKKTTNKGKERKEITRKKIVSKKITSRETTKKKIIRREISSKEI